MTARDAYQASVASAEKTKVATNQANALAAQETINGSGVNAGTNPALGVAAGSALDTATRNSNATLAAARMKAEHDKQVAIQAAKDTLRATGDLAPL
jgi:hypothetical protein